MDERRGTDGAAGSSDYESQMLMSNSEREWQASDDLNYRGGSRRWLWIVVDCTLSVMPC